MKKKPYYLLIFLQVLLISYSAKGQSTSENAINDKMSQDVIPFVLPDSAVKPLRTLVDEQMEKKLQQAITANKKWKRLVSQKKMAIGLVDLQDVNNIRFARINGNHMMYAASLPKISILLATMDAFEKGELEETEEIYADLNAMISKSDNQASTRMIDRLSFEKIESVMTDPRYEFYDEDFGGGLWVGKRYASTGRRYPEPIKGLSHAATASQVSRFYYLLAAGRLISRERSRQMLEIMDDPALHHKFVSTLEKIAPRARLFRKSGSWRNYHSDSILVWGPERRYILVALINDPDGERIIRQLVMPVERVLNSQ